jgi:hypothetical protein
MCNELKPISKQNVDVINSDREYLCAISGTLLGGFSASAIYAIATTAGTTASMYWLLLVGPASALIGGLTAKFSARFFCHVPYPQEISTLANYNSINNDWVSQQKRECFL